MTKKNLKVAALKYEISKNTEEVLDILAMLDFISGSTFFVDSDAECWLEDEPSEADMDEVLKILGY